MKALYFRHSRTMEGGRDSEIDGGSGADKASDRFTGDYFLQSRHSLICNGKKASYG